MIFVFALMFGLFDWQMTSMGLVYLVYSIVLVFFNEIFRAKAVQSLEINTLSILMSSSIFIIYGIELLVGREQLDAKNVMGMILFLSAFYLFLDVKLRDFLKINRLGLLYVSGLLIITVIDRPIAKTVFDNEWISPGASVLLRIFILMFVFYFMAKKNGISLKVDGRKGVKDHAIIGFLKYFREMFYSYALVFGSVLMVSLVINTSLFITFILSGFYFKESKWTLKKGVSVCIVIVGIILITI